MKLHFMGDVGSGTKGVSLLAKKMGYEVSGCDLKANGHSLAHLKNIDFLIISPAILFQNNNHPEYITAKKRGIVMTWQEFLGKVLLKDKKVIAVAGTHGKSTTTAMISKLLIDNGFDPICVVGANVPEWKANSRYGKGEWAVVEADEFNDNFLNYSPEIAIITNIEFDHPDYFKNLDEVKKSFNKFTTRSHLVIKGTKNTKKFNMKILGEHNQKNANLVFLLGKTLKIPEEKITKSIESFTGIGRRMELIGKTKSGALVYDDYAHHPTAIKATLQGLREKYPDKKILAIIEPHGYKRTKVLMSLYKNAFNSVDGVVIGPIFKARDVVDKTVTQEKVVKISNHPNIKAINKFSNYKLPITNLKKYDIVVVMGAGNSNLWSKKLLKN